MTGDRPTSKTRASWPLRAVATTAALALASSLWTTPPAAQIRAVEAKLVALVIGNSRYDGAPVPQAALDAKAVGQRLEARGFRLVNSSEREGCREGAVHFDLDAEGLRGAIDCFSIAAKGAHQAIVYFSGHTLRLEQQNMLVPVGVGKGAKLDDQSLVPLTLALDALRQSGAALSAAVLDGSRISVKSIAPDAAPMARAPVATHARILAYSAAAGVWNEDAPPAQAAPRGAPDAANATDDGPASAYTSRLVRQLDLDLDLRSRGQPGADAVAILLRASQPAAGESGRAGEILVENVTSSMMLGRLPAFGNAFCDQLTWRTRHLGRCIEIAAAFEHCGKQQAVAERLQRSCPGEWGIIAQQRMHAAMNAASKKNTCDALTAAVRQFENEPAVTKQPAFEQARTMMQYACAVEAEAKLKAECKQFRHSAPSRCLDREETLRIVQSALKAASCDAAIGTGQDWTRRLMARVTRIDSSASGLDISPDNFTQVERLLKSSNQSDVQRLCAPFVVEDKLNPTHRGIARSETNALRDAPFAAVAVPKACSSAKCTGITVAKADDAEEARRKAVAECQAKHKACLLIASHRIAGSAR